MDISNQVSFDFHSLCFVIFILTLPLVHHQPSPLKLPLTRFHCFYCLLLIALSKSIIIHHYILYAKHWGRGGGGIVSEWFVLGISYSPAVDGAAASLCVGEELIQGTAENTTYKHLE